MAEMFDSSARSLGDVAGVFEYDDSTGYFYLYELTGSHGNKILDSIHVVSGEPDFCETDVSIRWDQREQKVGLFIRGKLLAVFDYPGRAKYGGRYRPGSAPVFPPDVTAGFLINS